MIQVGSILKETRVKKGLSIADVEKATKIRSKFIEAIEANDFAKIPSLVYTKGFIKNYGDYLGLDSAVMLAFFRRQSQTPQKSTIVPKGMAESRDIPLFQLTPGKYIGILLSFFVGIFLLYFGLQYKHLYDAPFLEIEKPVSNQMFEERKIDVMGKTGVDATIVINGVSTVVRTDGKFFDQVSLVPGINTVTVTATSRFGKTTTIVRKVGLKQ